MVKWFGKNWGAPICHATEQVDTPVGQDCTYCSEPIVEGENGFILSCRSPFHYECHMRMIVGSVGHLMKACSCYGITDTSEDGLTKREAARSASDCFEAISSICTPINRLHLN